MSFRTRLLAVALTTLAVGLGALLVIGNVLLGVREHSETSRVLRGRIDAEVAALDVRRTGIRVRETANDRALDRAAWVFDGGRAIERPAGASPALERAALALGRSTVATEVNGPNHFRLRVAPVVRPGGGQVVGAVVAGVSTTPVDHLRREVLVGSLVFSAIVLVAAALAIQSALRSALRPVADMTRSADDWGAHDLDRRFALGPPRDELSGLAATLDHLLARIAASRRHEQRFASEVAHELRTPLAGMRGTAELALGASGPDAERERTDALRGVLDQADRLNSSIDALMAVARREIDPAAGVVDVAAVVREFDDVEVQLPPHVPGAEGEHDVVRQALAPLVENARRHAHSRVVLSVSSGDGRVRVSVRDDGPGLEPELRERAFEPGVRGASAANGGGGLGLPLARRLARSCGGDVVATDGPGGCFVLELPEVAG